MDALDDVLRVVASLNAAAVEYVIVGGVAMNFHGLVRATEDLDRFVRPDPQSIERLRQALRSVGQDPDIEQITVDDLCGDYPVVRYGPAAICEARARLRDVGERERRNATLPVALHTVFARDWRHVFVVARRTARRVAF